MAEQERKPGERYTIAASTSPRATELASLLTQAGITDRIVQEKVVVTGKIEPTRQGVKITTISGSPVRT